MNKDLGVADRNTKLSTLILASDVRFFQQSVDGSSTAAVEGSVFHMLFTIYEFCFSRFQAAYLVLINLTAILR